MLFYILTALMVIFSLVIEGALTLFFPWRALPDLTLILVVTLSFLLGEERGAILGLAAGLLEDILFGYALGFFALSKMLLGMGAGLAGKEVYREKAMGPVLLVFAGTIIHEVLVYILVYLYVGLDISLEASITRVFLPKALLNAVLTVPIYSLVLRMVNRRPHMWWNVNF